MPRLAKPTTSYEKANMALARQLQGHYKRGNLCWLVGLLRPDSDLPKIKK